jgi:small subunit ribosomal protein S8
MAATDPIADLLTRIRNAQLMGHDAISLPASKLKQHVAEALAAEGYVRDVEFKAEGPQGVLTIGLKYGPDKLPAINEIRRVSRPGRRVYVGVQDIPRVKNGLGVAILSTSKGVLVDREARKNRLGGELLCTVW